MKLIKLKSRDARVLGKVRYQCSSCIELMNPRKANEKGVAVDNSRT